MAGAAAAVQANALDFRITASKDELAKLACYKIKPKDSKETTLCLVVQLKRDNRLVKLNTTTFSNNKYTLTSNICGLVESTEEHTGDLTKHFTFSEMFGNLPVNFTVDYYKPNSSLRKMEAEETILMIQESVDESIYHHWEPNSSLPAQLLQHPPPPYSPRQFEMKQLESSFPSALIADLNKIINLIPIQISRKLAVSFLGQDLYKDLNNNDVKLFNYYGNVLLLFNLREKFITVDNVKKFCVYLKEFAKSCQLNNLAMDLDNVITEFDKADVYKYAILEAAEKKYSEAYNLTCDNLERRKNIGAISLKLTKYLHTPNDLFNVFLFVESGKIGYGWAQESQYNGFDTQPSFPDGLIGLKCAKLINNLFEQAISSYLKTGDIAIFNDQILSPICKACAEAERQDIRVNLEQLQLREAAF